MDDMNTVFTRKFIGFAKQTNLYLNHFPKSEKYALSELDIAHARLKAKLLLAYNLGYFAFKDGHTDEKIQIQ